VDDRNDRGQLLLINTGEKVIGRRIFEAGPLSPSLARGYAAELATHDAATVWGLPDFVYLAPQKSVGKGHRELGDGLIIVGALGLVLQVKSRGAPGAQERERHWLQKKSAQALRQGQGSIRRLQSAPVRLMNRRGREIELEADGRQWLTVVVLDHDSPPPETEIPVSENAVAMLRRDWEFLFEQLKSTHAVAQYCARVSGDPLALGAEPARYYELAHLDSEASPKPLPASMVGLGIHVSKPLLPFAPVGNDDLEALALVRELMEAVAAHPPTLTDEAGRLRVLAELDRLPVTNREDVGRFLLDAIDELAQDSSREAQWRSRSIRGRAGGVHLGFVVCSREHSAQLQDVFGLWVRLRHHDMLVARGDVDRLLTVGCLLTPRAGGFESWDTTMAAIQGDPELTPEELAAARELWPTGGTAAAV
jgi:hypothetical protein